MSTTPVKRYGLVRVHVPGASGWQDPDGQYRFMQTRGMDTGLDRVWFVQIPDGNGGWSALDHEAATLADLRSEFRP